MDSSSDDDRTCLVVKLGEKRSKEELREAFVLTAKLLPPHVFAKVGPRHPQHAPAGRGSDLTLARARAGDP
jgi:hypothetical protein